MNYGLYLSAAGMLTSMYRQDVAANNLANTETTGFKRDLAMMKHRQPESLESFKPSDAHALLDRLGGGTHAARTGIDLSNGPLNKTGNNLDIALQGDGMFTVNTEQGTRLTRDGRFTLDPSTGHLVTTAGGHELLDTNGNPITVDRAQPVQIDARGVIRQNNAEVAQIRQLDVDSENLTHRGSGLFEAPESVLTNAPAGSAKVHQGYVEGSNIDPVSQMLEMIRASGAVSSNGQIIRYHDLVMNRAANVLGRVA